MTSPAPVRRRPPLPPPDPGPADAARWVIEHLAGLFVEDPVDVAPSPRFRGGQGAADRALGRFDVTGYAATRNEAFPVARRGSSGLSPYIRHGLLALPRVWAAVVDGGASDDDLRRFRQELLWQEYARHWYARLGRATARPLRHRGDPDWGRPPGGAGRTGGADALDDEMACVELTVGELEEDGWLVNQTRMWLASQWTVRLGLDWRAGEEWFFRHLLDGSRAANRLGWQWVSGLGSDRAYGFSRWQVERRAPGLCADCELGAACPIDRWPDDPPLVAIGPDRSDPRLARISPEAASVIAGPPPAPAPAPGPAPGSADPGPVDAVGPEAVWITAESLGLADPALTAHPSLPAVFVFDLPLLARLRLSAKRLIFLTETLSELATHRPVELHLGDPVEILAGRPLAATHTPVPGWWRRSTRLDLVDLRPWPWLRRPGPGPVSSYRAWLDGIDGLGGPHRPDPLGGSDRSGGPERPDGPEAARAAE